MGPGSDSKLRCSWSRSLATNKSDTKLRCSLSKSFNSEKSKWYEHAVLEWLWHKCERAFAIFDIRISKWSKPPGNKTTLLPPTCAMEHFCHMSNEILPNMRQCCLLQGQMTKLAPVTGPGKTSRDLPQHITITILNIIVVMLSLLLSPIFLLIFLLSYNNKYANDCYSAYYSACYC